MLRRLKPENKVFSQSQSKKTETKARAIDTEKMEDDKLAALIEKGMKTKTVSRESIMEILE